MGRAKIDLSGMRYGRLVVQGDSGRRAGKGEIIWLCLCDCGKTNEVIGGNLKNGHVSSCGCMRDEMSAQRRRDAKRPPVKCSISGCTDTIEKGGHGMCGRHAQRVRRYGDPNYITPEEVRRANSREAQLKNVSAVKETTYRKFMGRHEHRVVAEAVIGRPIHSWEHVHHKDENKHNNSPDNLQVMHWREHLKHHAIKRKKS